ncbi:hypothetical protein QSH57_005695 [Fusarium oxysporum f. sp. vasinfectum]|nr:hypothetical protein QSH57_005695 [Fusarium oxysporum f. sp. vasinfectum]
MSSDEIVWQIIGQQFCAFKIKTNKAQTFCRNEYNVTGLCNRQSCPLANSRYATVREDAGKLFLLVKTPERSHLPSKLWQRYKLPNNYSKALSTIDEKLIYWPNFLIHKCKQRLTRLTQVQTRMRRIAAEEERLGEKLVPKMAPKIRHREQARERKAEAAAKLERTIERELVERLRQGAYGDQPLNVSESIWKKVLNAMERDGEGQRDKDMDKGLDENGEEADWSEEEDDNLENQQLAAPPNQLRLRQSIALAPQTFNYSSSNSLGFDTASSTYIKRAHRETGATSYHLNNHRCETLQTY